MRSTGLAAMLVALVAAGAGIGIGVIVADDGGHHTRTITVRIGAQPKDTTLVDNADANVKRDDKIELGPVAQGLSVVGSPDVEDPLRGPDKTKAGVITGPLASQEWPGCRTAFVRNFSSRTKPIKAIAVHFTAGPNVEGWGDINGLTAFSNNAANQVSWHFSIDREGHCAYNVPITQKAWTISGLNSATVNIEGVGTGKEPNYLDTEGFKKLSSVIRRIGRIEHIPMRLGATDGHCNVTRSGIITHWMGGPCSGGHTDVRPYGIEEIVKRIAADQGPSLATLTHRHVAVHKRIRKLCHTKEARAVHRHSCTVAFKANRSLHAAITHATR